MKLNYSKYEDTNTLRIDTLYALNTSTGKLEWKFCPQENYFILKGHEGYFDVIVDEKKNVYAKNVDHNIYAINISGIQKWKFKTAMTHNDEGGLATARTELLNNTLYTRYDQKTLCVLDTLNGKIKWSTSINDRISSSLCDENNNNIYVSDSRGLLRAIDGVNGKEKWKYKLNTVTYNAPIVSKAENRIYIQDYNGLIYGLNTKTGKSEFFFSGGNGSENIFLLDTILYLIDYKRNLCAISSKSGLEQWSFPRQSRRSIEHLPTNKNVIYVQDASIVYAINTENGKKIWSYNLQNKEDGMISDPILNQSKTMLYVATWKGRVLGINAVSGKQEWEFMTEDFKDGKTYGTPVIGSIISDANNLYLTTAKGKVYSINTTNGKKLWSFQTNFYELDTRAPMIQIMNGTVYIYNKASIPGII